MMNSITIESFHNIADAILLLLRIFKENFLTTTNSVAMIVIDSLFMLLIYWSVTENVGNAHRCLHNLNKRDEADLGMCRSYVI